MSDKREKLLCSVFGFNAQNINCFHCWKFLEILAHLPEENFDHRVRIFVCYFVFAMIFLWFIIRLDTAVEPLRMFYG